MTRKYYKQEVTLKNALINLLSKNIPYKQAQKEIKRDFDANISEQTYNELYEIYVYGKK